MLIILGAGFYSLHSYKDKMNRQIVHYLTTEQGYTEKQLYKVYTQIGKAPVVSTTVIFADEPDARYFYRKEAGQIYQYSNAPAGPPDGSKTHYLHLEEDGG
ncbi:hypothetical protein B9T62_03430 [Paenibacillus donghaensis]|uniref:DUF3139 domain-containing protein n=2 Tax=Paenibacillus donghaensis TaxID=414771 RepID=A0A2Z2KX42_9BACL|nr:hypothetical protein B9T62_03430 [Paenibacillus donghaensis]